MPWIWDQLVGELIRPDGEYFASGYSGHGPGVNAPTYQAEHDVGPIPVGTYTICEPEESHGGFALPLEPGSANRMFGRGGFLIHGDLKDGPPLSASLGCIILPHWARMQIWGSEDHTLIVV